MYVGAPNPSFIVVFARRAVAASKTTRYVRQRTDLARIPAYNFNYR